MFRDYFSWLCAQRCKGCCRCFGGLDPEHSDKYEVIEDMADRRSSGSQSKNDADAEILSVGSLKLRPTGSFNSPILAVKREIPKLNRRHSSPALTQSAIDENALSKRCDEQENTTRRKSQLTTESLKKSNYPDLAGIAENSEDENNSTESSSASEWLGMLHFAVRTLPQFKRISVDVEKAFDLPRRGTVDSYYASLRITLDPGEQILFSKPCKSRCPTFKQSFDFEMASTEEVCHMLVLSAYDHERRDQPIGHVTCQLFQEDLSTELVRHYQKPLSRLSYTEGESLGELLIAASYVKTSRELKVTVLRGRNIKVGSSSQEIYLKASMVCAGVKIKSKKSKQTARVANPFFNHVFAFVVPSDYLDDVTMEMKLAVPSVLTKNRLIGRVVINPFTRHSDHDLCFWQRVISYDAPCRKWFIMTH